MSVYSTIRLRFEGAVKCTQRSVGFRRFGRRAEQGHDGQETPRNPIGLLGDLYQVSARAVKHRRRDVAEGGRGLGKLDAKTFEAGVFGLDISNTEARERNTVLDEKEFFSHAYYESSPRGPKIMLRIATPAKMAKVFCKPIDPAMIPAV